MCLMLTVQIKINGPILFPNIIIHSFHNYKKKIIIPGFSKVSFEPPLYICLYICSKQSKQGVMNEIWIKKKTKLMFLVKLITIYLKVAFDMWNGKSLHIHHLKNKFWCCSCFIKPNKISKRWLWWFFMKKNKNSNFMNETKQQKREGFDSVTWQRWFITMMKINNTIRKLQTFFLA